MKIINLLLKLKFLINFCEEIHPKMSSSAQTSQYGIQSTAGAIPIRNEKGKNKNYKFVFSWRSKVVKTYAIGNCLSPFVSGELAMKKVKVQRYISGKRPEYAQYMSSDEESADEDFMDRKAQKIFANRGDDITVEVSHRNEIDTYDDDDEDDDGDEQYGQAAQSTSTTTRHGDSPIHDYTEAAASDPRLRRLMEARKMEQENDDVDDGDRLSRRRRIHEPEVLESDIEEKPDESDDDENVDLSQEYTENARNRRIALASDSESETELSDSEIEHRRQKLRQKMLQQRKEEEVLMKEEEKQSEASDSDEESSEYEEETESEEENEPRLKPLFVRKRDRATIAEKEKEALKQKQQEQEAKRLAKERRRHTLRLVEESVKKDLEKAKVKSYF